MRYEAINKTINTDEWTPVALDAGQMCDTYAVQVRDGSGFKMKKRSDSESYWTVYGREKVVMNEARGVPGDVLFYAQAVSGTPVIEVLISRG